MAEDASRSPLAERDCSAEARVLLCALSEAQDEVAMGDTVAWSSIWEKLNRHGSRLQELRHAPRDEHADRVLRHDGPASGRHLDGDRFMDRCLQLRPVRRRSPIDSSRLPAVRGRRIMVCLWECSVQLQVAVAVRPWLRHEQVPRSHRLRPVPRLPRDLWHVPVAAAAA